MKSPMRLLLFSLFLLVFASKMAEVRASTTNGAATFCLNTHSSFALQQDHTNESVLKSLTSTYHDATLPASLLSETENIEFGVQEENFASKDTLLLACSLFTFFSVIILWLEAFLKQFLLQLQGTLFKTSKVSFLKLYHTWKIFPCHTLH